MISIALVIEPTTITKARSHALQEQLLSQQLALTAPIAIDRSKKPTIINHPAEFSVSHTHHLFCLASHPSEPIGIDIEFNNRKISDNVLNRGLIQPSPPLPNEYRVQYWTQFEANAKCDGTGIRFPIPAFPQHPTISFSWQNAVVSVACIAPITQTKFTIHHYNQQHTSVIQCPSNEATINGIQQLPTVKR